MTTQPPQLAWSSAYQFIFQLEAMQRQSPKAIDNIVTELEPIFIDGHAYPLTRNEKEYRNSYVCSPYTAYVHYAKDELVLLNSKVLQWSLKGVITILAGLLKLGRINQTVSVNNWLFSTNIMPDWDAKTIKHLTEKLINANPLYSLSIRSLNQETDGELIQHLKKRGWLMLPARQVYLFMPEGHPDGHWWKRNNVKNDQRLLRNTSLTLVTPQQHKTQDFVEIERIFKQLFIDKHSAYNPQFSAEYFEMLHRLKLVEFFSFRNDEGRIVASIGLFTQHGVITAPIVGYDTELPKSLGLYRLLMAQLLKITKERNLPLNLSSGAGHFKRQRGGTPVVEYTALYIRHLPILQRGIQWGFTALLNRFAADFLQKHQL